MTNLVAKRVLITGAAGGLGSALARRFAASGAVVLLSDVHAATVRPIVTEIVTGGGRATGLALDVTSEESIGAARRHIAAHGGPIDVLVNNAGIVVGGAFHEVSLERHLDTLRINSLGVIATTHAFAADLIARPQAHIVNIASASGFIGLPFGATYASSKWAVIGLSESLRLEFAETGNPHVKVTTVCPSYADTGMFAGARPPLLTPMLTAEQLADRVVRAVERDRPFLKTPWTVHLLGLLRGVLPTAAFDAFARTFGVNASMRHWRGR